jgi:hypothetical protein
MTGMSVEEAKAALEELKEKQPDRYERIASLVGVLAQMGDKIKDPIVALIAAPLLRDALQQGSAPQGGGVASGIISAVDAVSQRVAALRALDAVLPSVGGKAEASDKLLEEIKDLRAKLEELREEKYKEQISGIQDLISATLEKLENLEKQVKEIKEKPPTPPATEKPPEKPPTAEDIIKRILEEEENAKKLLKLRGYRVEEGLSPEEVRKVAESWGWKIVEGKVPLEEVEKLRAKTEEEMKKLAEAMYKKGREDAAKEFDEKMIERQINAVKDIVEKTVDRIVGEIFAPVVKAWLGGETVGAAGKAGVGQQQAKPQGS